MKQYKDHDFWQVFFFKLLCASGFLIHKIRINQNNAPIGFRVFNMQILVLTTVLTFSPKIF